MIKVYKTDEMTGELKSTEIIEKGTWINLVCPDEEEINRVVEETGVEEQFIRYALDSEEKARVDIEENDQVMILVDVPLEENKGDITVYTTMPLGTIVVRDDYIITVANYEFDVIKEFEYSTIKTFFTFKKTRFIFQMLYKISQKYLKYLYLINRETDKVETLLQKSMKNKELIKLLNLEKSLVYFTTSLKSNELVMERLMRGTIVRLYDDDDEILDDAIIENKQAIEMTKTYSDVLSGMMDAYASIISNNLNIVMKFLAGITIVLSIPTMVASFFGMNVVIPPLFAGEYGFKIILISVVVISIATLFILKKNKMM